MIKDRKNLLIIILIVILIAILLPKPYAQSGGFEGKAKTGKCIGYEFNSYPVKQCADCSTTYYCVGIPIPSK